MINILQRANYQNMSEQTNILVKLDQIKHYTKTSQEVMNNIYEGLNDIVVAKPFVISVFTRI
ncbi:MAG: hypothetical protein AB8V03_05430 [Francisella endosymbiont of Hyalomma asiaticum]